MLISSFIQRNNAQPNNPIAVMTIAVASATCPITDGCTSTFAITLIIKQGVPMFITMREIKSAGKSVPVFPQIKPAPTEIIIGARMASSSLSMMVTFTSEENKKLSVNCSRRGCLEGAWDAFLTERIMSQRLVRLA